MVVSLSIMQAVIATNFSAAQMQVDQTLEDGANGSDVVEMVIARISWTNIFDSDHRLLRRIAYVETNDGTSGVPPGGIWAVDECTLKTVLKEAKLMELHEIIDQEFDINFSETTHSLLMKPLFSGLVARLYLHYLNITKNADIPLAAAISDQAKFWHRYYYNGKCLTVDDFTQKVRELEKKEGQLRCLFFQTFEDQQTVILSTLVDFMPACVLLSNRQMYTLCVQTV